MITSFRHKGLGAFHATGSKRGIQPDHAAKLGRILSMLNVAVEPQDLAIPGFRTHELAGEQEGTWSVRVNGNWRVTFRFTGTDVELLDYVDYH